MRSGWFRERYRHSLAARGVSTKRYAARKYLMAISGKQLPTKQLKVIEEEKGPEEAARWRAEVLRRAQEGTPMTTRELAELSGTKYSRVPRGSGKQALAVARIDVGDGIVELPVVVIGKDDSVQVPKGLSVGESTGRRMALRLGDNVIRDELLSLPKRIGRLRSDIEEERYKLSWPKGRVLDTDTIAEYTRDFSGVRSLTPEERARKIGEMEFDLRELERRFGELSYLMNRESQLNDAVAQLKRDVRNAERELDLDRMERDRGLLFSAERALEDFENDLDERKLLLAGEYVKSNPNDVGVQGSVYEYFGLRVPIPQIGVVRSESRGGAVGQMRLPKEGGKYVPLPVDAELQKRITDYRSRKRTVLVN